MIDVDNILDKLHPELKEYVGIPQIIRPNQNIPADMLTYPRMAFNFIVRSSPGSRISTIAIREVIPSTNESFQNDIEYSYVSLPTSTISIQAFGKNINSYLRKASEWFQIHELGGWFFEKYKGVIVDTTDIQDQKTFLETGYEDRAGFDVIIRFEDIIKVRVDTIEEVVINGKSYSI